MRPGRIMSYSRDRVMQYSPRYRACDPSKIPGKDNMRAWAFSACTGAAFRSSLRGGYLVRTGQRPGMHRDHLDRATLSVQIGSRTGETLTEVVCLASERGLDVVDEGLCDRFDVCWCTSENKLEEG